MFAHVNVRWRLRPLWKVIMTPEFHHWHHSNTPESIHANYSVGLPIWDIIFGTYYMPEDRRPEVYGHDEDMPETVSGQWLWPFKAAARRKYPFPPALRSRLARLVPFRNRRAVTV